MIFAVFLALIVIFVILPLAGVALWYLLSIFFVGLVVGLLGRLVVPGRTPIGIWATVGCGLIGSIFGSGIGRAINHGRFITILLEIAIAAAAVALWSGTHRRTTPVG